MNIIAWPAFKLRDYNPYGWLLYNHVKNFGVNVDEFSPGKLLKNRYAIWHIHWPEHVLYERRMLNAFIKIHALLFMIDWARARGIKVVWTAHNLSSHERTYPRLENFFWKAFSSRLDAYFSLTEVGIKSVKERFSNLSAIPCFLTPHGHYRGEYPDNLNYLESRNSLGIPNSAKVVLFFGVISPYKNVTKLIRAFRDVSSKNAVLQVAGQPKSWELMREMKREAAKNPKVQLHLQRIPNDKVQVFFRAADLVVLPYRDIFNSGSALLSLSFDRPILVPLVGALTEIQKEMGTEWVRTYDGEITSLAIDEALEWAVNVPRSVKSPVEFYDWNQIALQTIYAYKAVIKEKPYSNLSTRLSII